jgi:hypothetical protein
LTHERDHGRRLTESLTCFELVVPKVALLL